MRRFVQPRLERLAGEQDGVVDLGQLRRLGVGDETVRSWARTGRLHRLYRGVYAVGRAEVPLRGRFRAAVMAVKGAVLSHRSAAALWGFRPWEEDDPVEVLTTRATKAPAGIMVHRTRRLPARDVRARAGIPLTEPHRTLLDLADVLPYRPLRRALGQAEVMRLVSHPRLHEQLARSHGRHGAPTLKALLARGPAPTRSHLEDEVVDFLHRHGITGACHNARVCGMEVDVFFPDERLVIEIDGREFHDTPTARANDAEKTRRLEAAGCRVMRLGQPDLTPRTAARIVAARSYPSTRRTSAGAASRTTPASP